MKKTFKIGDRIRIIEDNFGASNLAVGCTGEIINIFPPFYAVKADTEGEDYDGNYCPRAAPYSKGDGWLFCAGELEAE